MRDTSSETSLNHLIQSRRSVRAFEANPVPRATVEDILLAASRAPSNSNTQPWKVDVLVGDAKRNLTSALMEMHRRDGTMPSGHFPVPFPAENRERQIAFGALFYGAYGIARGDTEAATEQLALNYDFYGAPVGLLLTIDSLLLKHSWMDCGIFLGNFMLAAQARGLGTCAQVVFAHHEKVIIEKLGLPPGRSVVCGISLGIPRSDAAINNVTYAREPLSAFCTFRGYDTPATEFE